MRDITDKIFDVLLTTSTATNLFNVTRRCGYCRKPGHYAKRCPARRKCSKCRGVGHYASTCRFSKKELARMNRSVLQMSKNKTSREAPQARSQMADGKISGKAAKALFDTALKFDGAIKEHESQIEKLTVQRSEAIGAIVSQLGKGPFQVSGKMVQIRSRKGYDVSEGPNGEEVKKENGKEHFYFVSAGADVTVID